MVTCKVSDPNWQANLMGSFDIIRQIQQYNWAVANYLAMEVVIQAEEHGQFTCCVPYDEYFEDPDEWEKLISGLFLGGKRG
jgi:hypothetical protein